MDIRKAAKKMMRKINKQSPKPIGFRDDRLAKRQRLHDEIQLHAENGIVAIVWSGRDCDGVSSCYATQYKACAFAIECDVYREYEHAEGPLRFEFARPSDIESFKGYSRDLSAEAYENGHNHIVYG